MPTIRHTSGPPKPVSCHCSPSDERTPCSTRGGSSDRGEGTAEAAREVLGIVMVPFERWPPERPSHTVVVTGVSTVVAPRLRRQWVVGSANRGRRRAVEQRGSGT